MAYLEYAVVRVVGNGPVWRIKAEGLSKREATELVRKLSFEEPRRIYYIIDQDELEVRFQKGFVEI